jgi:Nuclease A inhibitor-like protein
MVLQHSVSLTLKEASEGLLFTSESNYPLTIWELPVGTEDITNNNALSVLASAVQIEGDGRIVEASDLSWFFDRYTIPQDYWEDSHHKQQARWEAVRTAIETALSNVQVLRIGQSSNWGLFGSIDVFVFGLASDGTVVGLHTVAVET